MAFRHLICSLFTSSSCNYVSQGVLRKYTFRKHLLNELGRKISEYFTVPCFQLALEVQHSLVYLALKFILLKSYRLYGGKCVTGRHFKNGLRTKISQYFKNKPVFEYRAFISSYTTFLKTLMICTAYSIFDQIKSNGVNTDLFMCASYF